CRIYITSPLTF
nr:immunoglobulin light chain junction region [Macaca mulatta]